MSIPIIILFVKAPRAGQVKTRLTPLLSPDAAAEVAACFAQDALRNARKWIPDPGILIVAYAPADALSFLQKSLAEAAPLTDHVRFLPQQGNDLGERLENAVAVAAAQGWGPLILLGTDCPLLPGGAVRDSFARLLSGQADVVLGPAEDGGYYLLGLRQPTPGLLDNIAWSTETVFAQTQANAERLGLRLYSDLPVCYDIDTATDLVRLRDDLAANAAHAEQAAMAARWLRSHLLPPLTASASDAGERP